MRNKNLIVLGSLLMIFLSTIIIMSCNKKFDEPPVIQPVSVDTSITNHLISIRALRAKHTIGNLEQITDSSVITGIVSGDDRNGNLYKEITLQDSTAGITILLDQSGLYASYPVGRQLYIKCHGLYISDASDNIELGALNSTVPTNLAITAIPSPYFDNYIVKGTLGNTVTPKIVTLGDLNSIASLSAANIPTQDTLQSTLVQLDNVEIATTDIGLIYADTSAAKKSVSRNITDCIGTTGVVIYTSGYANFAGFAPPSGKGTFTAIYVPYKTTAELEVLDTSNVQLYGTRCGPAVAKTLFSETFPGITNKATITTTGSSNVWKNIAEVGGVQYTGYVSGTTHYASISGYGASGNPADITSWLITQAISIPAGTNLPSLTFVSEDGYYAGATFQVLVSTNYNGGNTPSASTWTVLPATIPTGDAKYTTAVSSGSIDLSSYIGQTIYLAWRYTTTATSQTGTGYEFGNVQVIGY
jgi:hypothetical protein